jgi:hypothetical protein
VQYTLYNLYDSQGISLNYQFLNGKSTRRFSWIIRLLGCEMNHRVKNSIVPYVVTILDICTVPKLVIPAG